MTPRLIAHRGASRLRRENTIEAFTVALDQGADGLELDVHATQDGVVVVHHDPGLRNGKLIAHTRYRELDDDSVPTLGEVLALAGERAHVYVEIKAEGVERAVVEAIRSGSARASVHSFDHRIARLVRSLAPDIEVGVLSTSYPIDPVRQAIDAGALDLWQEWRLIDEEMVEAAHASGLRVIAWTVNDAAGARKLSSIGVDGLCGDDLDLLRSSLPA
jgi:glycerophosphoryl diester phosphodiesterase